MTLFATPPARHRATRRPSSIGGRALECWHFILGLLGFGSMAAAGGGGRAKDAIIKAVVKSTEEAEEVVEPDPEVVEPEPEAPEVVEIAPNLPPL